MSHDNYAQHQLEDAHLGAANSRDGADTFYKPKSQKRSFCMSIPSSSMEAMEVWKRR